METGYEANVPLETLYLSYCSHSLKTQDTMCCHSCVRKTLPQSKFKTTVAALTMAMVMILVYEVYAVTSNGSCFEHRKQPALRDTQALIQLMEPEGETLPEMVLYKPRHSKKKRIINSLSFVRKIVHRSERLHDKSAMHTPYSNTATIPPIPFMGNYTCRDKLCREFLSHFDKMCYTYCTERLAYHHEKEPALVSLKPGNCHFMNGTNRAAVALASFPGSGNTWVRGLLEQATGICTGIIII